MRTSKYGIPIALICPIIGTCGAKIFSSRDYPTISGFDSARVVLIPRLNKEGLGEVVVKPNTLQSLHSGLRVSISL